MTFKMSSPDNAEESETTDQSAATIVDSSDDQSRRSTGRAGDTKQSWVFPIAVAVIAVAIIGLLTVFSSADDTTPIGAADGDVQSAILALPFTNQDGSTGTLSDFSGEPLVVNFFASWCAPCRAELPDFEAVHQARGDEVTFVGINQDFNEESWKAFVAETNVTYETVFQPGSEIWNELATSAMPSTAFISAKR